MTSKEREDLFRRWLDEHKGLVYRIVRAYAIGPQDQADLFQDILAQLWFSIPSFRSESKPSTWVYRVALNTALAWRRAETRRRQRYRPLVEIGEPPASPGTASSAETDGIVEKLYVEIRRLPEVDRSLVLLHLDGLSYRDMADILGMSEDNVGVKLNRIRKKLTEAMKGLTDEP